MKQMKRMLAVFLMFIMLALTVPAVIGANSDYQVGDTIQFGTYPQTRVLETKELKMAADSAVWRSYDYYSGTYMPVSGQTEEEWDHDAYTDGKMCAGDFMRFADFFYGGEKYRAVTFNSYRPALTGVQSSETTSYQDDNGYSLNTIYYFKYEPLTWRILDPSTGLVFCEQVIDAQAFQNTVFRSTEKPENGWGVGYYQSADSSYLATDYSKCSLRSWLNNDFFETAFSKKQKANVLVSTLSDDYGTDATLNDKVFLLSSSDVVNADYGFLEDSFEKDLARKGQGTAYAKCQGLYCFESDSINYLSYNENSNWWTRSKGGFPDTAYSVPFWTGADGSYYFKFVGRACDGVRPACKLATLANDIEKSDELYSEIIQGQTPAKPATDPTTANSTTNLNFFQRIIQWFKNLFAKLFGR